MRLSLTILIILGIHTSLSITSGAEVVFPYILSAAAAGASLFINWKSVTPAALRALFYIFALCFAQIFIIYIFYGYYAENLRSVSVLILSIIIGYAVYLNITRSAGSSLSASMLILSIFIIIGSYLEIYGGLSEISDAFREYANGWRAIYEYDFRDIANYGAIRPKFFASEPSTLGYTVSITLMIWFLTSSSRGPKQIAMYFIYSFSAVYVIRSPVIIMYFIAAISLVVFRDNSGRHGRFVSLLAVTFIAIGTPLLMSFFVVAYATQNLDFYYLETGSFFIRQPGPALVALETMKVRPVTGFGMGDSQDLYETILWVYQSYDANVRFPYIVDATTRPKNLLSNSAMEFWIYFGLGGGILMIGLVANLCKALSLRQPAFILACVYFLLFAIPGFNAPQPWMLFFILVAIQVRHQTTAAADKAAAMSRSSPSLQSSDRAMTKVPT